MLDWSQKQGILNKFWKYSNLEFIDFTDCFYTILSEAKVFIGAWWYGTLTDLLACKVPSYLFVNQNEVVNINQTEQSVRIDVFKNYIPTVLVEKIDQLFVRELIKTYYTDTTKQLRKKILSANSDRLFNALFIHE